jgi:methyl-accepting chemotaxis protein
MSKIFQPTEVAELRRALLNLASLMLLAVLITGITGLFAIWSLSGFHGRTANTLHQVTSAVDHARLAQTHFKSQVQEWKNILLRGDLAADRAHYAFAFEKEKQTTIALLKALPAKITPLNAAFNTVDQSQFELLSKRLTALNQAYAQALNLATSDDGWKPLSADKLVRGADRELGQQMDVIPEQITAAAAEFLQRAQITEAQRFETLSRVVWCGMLLALTVVALTLWRILKHPALSP